MVKITRSKKSKTDQQLALLTKVIQILTVGWVIFFLWSNFGPGSKSATLSQTNTKSASLNGPHHAGIGKEVNGSVRGGTRTTANDAAEAQKQKQQENKPKQGKPIIKKESTNESSNNNDNNNTTNEKIKPSKPLRETNRDIISTAPMVDLSYIDVTDGHQNDPHRGAKDENGDFGYVHDEKALKNNPPPFSVTKQQVHCDNHDGNYKMLTEKVKVDLVSHEAREREAESSSDNTKRRAKIFCMVYTIQKNHDKIPVIRETWGQKCDGFIVASDKTDKSLGTVNIPHEGPEEYNNIWQKVRSMWSYVYDNYYEEYDWFHIGGDDLYIIVENLRLYLESEEVQLAANGGEHLPKGIGTEKEQKPLFLGRRFAEQGNYERIFNSGGSGYTLNKAALKSLVVTAFPVCMPHLKTFAEDVMVAQCLRNKIHVFPFDTKDDVGGERYMPFQPGHHLTYRPPANKKDDWYANYSIDIKYGLDHCSAQSVAFHYIKPPLMRRLHAILYGHCA